MIKLFLANWYAYGVVSYLKCFLPILRLEKGAYLQSNQTVIVAIKKNMILKKFHLFANKPITNLHDLVICYIDKTRNICNS